MTYLIATFLAGMGMVSAVIGGSALLPTADPEANVSASIAHRVSASSEGAPVEFVAVDSEEVTASVQVDAGDTKADSRTEGSVAASAVATIETDTPENLSISSKDQVSGWPGGDLTSAGTCAANLGKGNADFGCEGSAAGDIRGISSSGSAMASVQADSRLTPDSENTSIFLGGGGALSVP
jgi:hypothetical protein